MAAGASSSNHCQAGEIILISERSIQLVVMWVYWEVPRPLERELWIEAHLPICYFMYSRWEGVFS